MAKFKAGDRVRLNPVVAIECDGDNWVKMGFDYGTLMKHTTSDFGVGHRAPNAIKDGNWSVRWDGYDYGGSPGNCHTVNECVLLPVEPDEREMAEALASIERAARTTMSTRRLP